MAPQSDINALIRRINAQHAVLNATQHETFALASVGISAGIGRAMQEAGGELNKTQRLVARVLEEKKLSAGTRRRIHEDAGRAAQRSLVAGYTNRRRRRGTPPYRINAKDPRNNRLAGGILRRALNNPSMVKATADSVFFIDAATLDREAAHWRRINFGAGRIGGSPGPGEFQMRWGSLVIGALGLTDGPSPAFRIPRGFWFENEFYPTGEQPGGRGKGRLQKPRMTFGIAASQFLDAGVRRLAQELPRGYVGAIEAMYVTDPIKFQKVADEVKVPIKVFRPPGAGAFRVRRGRF